MSTGKTDTACRDEKPKSAPVPRDARLISLILASMGIEDVEPAVLVQLLEFAHRMWLFTYKQDIHPKFYKMH